MAVSTLAEEGTDRSRQYTNDSQETVALTTQITAVASVSRIVNQATELLCPHPNHPAWVHQVAFSSSVRRARQVGVVYNALLLVVRPATLKGAGDLAGGS